MKENIYLLQMLENLITGFYELAIFGLVAVGVTVKLFGYELNWGKYFRDKAIRQAIIFGSIVFLILFLFCFTSSTAYLKKSLAVSFVLAFGAGLSFWRGYSRARKDEEARSLSENLMLKFLNK